jgi:hypothetical protein
VDQRDQCEAVRMLVASVQDESCIVTAIDALLRKARATLSEEAADRVYRDTINIALRLQDYLMEQVR